jgi:hypothetical protein
MKRNFILYEQAFGLKQLGFDEICLGHYQDRDEKTLHGARLESDNIMFFHGETNKGFIVNNSPVSHCVLAPLYQEAFDWFRDNHKLHCWITSKTIDDEKVIFIPHGRTIPDTLKKGLVVDIIPYAAFENIEQAKLESIKKLIEICKNK